ncbi:energy transducer TonB [Psychroflexus salinarum]|uniref:Energy transducer TonB n=1 Tax=Psychroflexus salinarum TaxID=546024 RepID=A0ABW3GP63_9FLAO
MWWYLLDVILFQTCFLGLYLLFKKETFYAQNRVYLLVTAVLSFLIPLLDLSFLAFSFGSEETSSPAVAQLQSYFMIGEEVNLNASGANAEAQTSTWSLDATLKLIYLIGISFFAIKFSIGYWKLKQMTKKASFERYIHTVKYYKLEASENAFTFWNSIFVGDNIPETQREKVMAHELEHARSKHAMDLFFTEFLRMLCWISPAHHWLKRELVLVHELQADAVAAKDLNKRDYAQSLLNQAFGTTNFEFSHSFFNHSQLKQRLMMLQKKNSHPQNLLKYLLILPLLGLMLTYTACEVQNYQDRTEVTEVEKTGGEIGDVPFSVIENVPVFPGCEGLESNEERKECMSEKISQFVNENFDVNLAEDLGLTGVNRVYVQFKIDETGKITNVAARAPHPDLQAEGERVISKLPEMQPGKQKGKKVGVLYSLPVTFQIGENNTNKNMEKSPLTEIKENKVSYSGDVPFAVVENVPVFPGCEGLASNKERKECMSKNISQFVNQNFNTSLTKGLGLTGTIRVYAQFKIDKTGEVVNVRTRAPHPKLDDEAKRVVSLLPKTQPGKHEGEKVGVLYAIPITFNVYE